MNSFVISAVLLGTASVWGICDSSNILTPDLYPPESPTCPPFADLIPEYSMPFQCSILFNKLRCNLDAIGDFKGYAQTWKRDSDELDTLCFDCLTYSKYVVDKLSTTGDPGCEILVSYLDTLCQVRFSNTTEEVELCPLSGDSIDAYVSYNLPFGMFDTCYAPSCCDNEYLNLIQTYIDYAPGGTYENNIFMRFPSLENMEFNIYDVCYEFINDSGWDFVQVNEVSDVCVGPSYDAYSSQFQWNPYFIPESASEGTTQCDASTATSPAIDGTCSAWDSLILYEGVSQECITLVNNVKCNMDSLTSSSTESNFFKNSEVELMCNGACAPFVKYVTEALESEESLNDPGCRFIREFLRGTCTLFTYSGSDPELCINRGSAIFSALKKYTVNETIGTQFFQSACAAYSCCEDQALAILPHYFELTDSIVEIGLTTGFPETVASGTITVKKLCTEKGFDGNLARNGDSCVSSFVDLEAYAPSDAATYSFTFVFLLLSIGLALWS